MLFHNQCIYPVYYSVQSLTFTRQVNLGEAILKFLKLQLIMSVNNVVLFFNKSSEYRLSIHEFKKQKKNTAKTCS